MREFVLVQQAIRIREPRMLEVMRICSLWQPIQVCGFKFDSNRRVLLEIRKVINAFARGMGPEWLIQIKELRHGWPVSFANNQLTPPQIIGIKPDRVQIIRSEVRHDRPRDEWPLKVFETWILVANAVDDSRGLRIVCCWALHVHCADRVDCRCFN